MIVPVTNATTEVRVSIWSNFDIVVFADVARFTNRALVCLILFFAFENLHQMTNDGLAGVYGYRRCRPACALGVGQPVR